MMRCIAKRSQFIDAPGVSVVYSLLYAAKRVVYLAANHSGISRLVQCAKCFLRTL